MMRAISPIFLMSLVILLLLTSQAWAASPPSAVSVSPEADTSIPGEPIYITATYSDMDGYENLYYVYLIIGTSVADTERCLVAYDRTKNILRLRKVGTSGWYDGAPGSDTMLVNSYAKLDCSKSTVTNEGNTTIVKWAIILRKSFAGKNCNTYLSAYDYDGLRPSPVWQDKGDREVLDIDRAVWVWSMADDVVLDEPQGSREVFFSFCAAPHGNDDRPITRVYLSGSVWGKDLVVDYATELRSFIADAYTNHNLKVECLQGDKYWATPDYRGIGETRCDEIIKFNKDSLSDDQRFDGIHYDVEPHGLRYERDDPYDWDADNRRLWSEYLTLLANCQAKVDTYNATYTDIKFGADIAWWYDIDRHSYDPQVYGFEGSPNDIQKLIDYVTIMDYRDTGTKIVEGAATEISNGDVLGKEVFIGVETAQAVPPDPETISFYEEGNEYMEEQFGYTARAFAANTSFSGFAIHYYEDTNAGEVAYRGLWSDSFPGYHPIVKVTFPNGDEGIDFVPGTTYDVTWKTSDRDDRPEDLSIDIAYSADGGANWTSIATGESNDGTYAWNTTGLSDGAEYRIKVIATDDTLPTNLSGYDTSNYSFTFSSTSSSPPEWSFPKDTRVNGARPIIIPDGDVLHMVWYWPGWGSTATGVYYKKSTDKGVTWGSTVILAEDPAGGTVQPRKPAFAARGNNLAVVWVEGAGTYGNQRIKVKISNDGGTNWTTDEIQGSDSYKWPDFPDVAMDSSSNIYVVWQARELPPSDERWFIHYRSRIGGSWQNRETVVAGDYYNTNVDNRMMWILTPAITVDTNGVHVVFGDYHFSSWIDPTTRYFIRYRKKSGGSWGNVRVVAPPVTITANVWTKYFPKIYSDSSNKLHVVWQTAGDNPQTDSPPITSDIYYRSSANAGGTWSTLVNLGKGYVPMINSTANDLRVIYYVPSATTSGKGDIRYKKSVDGSSWPTPEAIITTDARAPYGSETNFPEDIPTMVGFPSLASGSMVAAWRGYSNDHIMFSYKDMFGSPTNLFANLVYASSDSLKLTWEKPFGYTPNSYSLYRSVNNGSYSLRVSPIYDVEYTDTGLLSTNYYKYKVMAMEGTTESLFSSISNALYPGENFLVDYFEGYEGIDYGKVENLDSTLAYTYDYDPADLQQGLRSIQLNYAYSGSGWGAVLQGSFPTNLDISDYEIVRFWAKGVNGATAMAIQFRETGRPEGYETWTSSAATTGTSWQQYEFSLSEFTRIDVEEGKEGNNNFDKRSIGSYQISFSDITADGTYWVDKIELYRAPPSLEVSPSSVIFESPPGSGTISGTASDHRFQTTAINIKYSGFRTPWTVRVFTDNSPGNGPEPEKAGLKGVVDSLIYVPLKVWCANYGPREFTPPPGPDEENDYFWKGYDFNGDGDKEDSITSGGPYVEADYGFDIDGDGEINDTIEPSPAESLSEEPVWLRVPEKDEMDPNNRYTWRRFCWNDGLGDDAGLGGDFNIYLAIDTTDVAKLQEYGTILTVEYINQ